MLAEVMLEAVPVSNLPWLYKYLDFYFDDEAEDGSDDLRTSTWFLVDMPIEHFGCKFTIDELGPMMSDPWRHDHEKEREATILAWVEDDDGWEKSLKKCPIVAAIRRGELYFVDGWHRAKLARLAGQTTVYTLVSVREPEPDQPVIRSFREETRV
jgi:hypothetical protein